MKNQTLEIDQKWENKLVDKVIKIVIVNMLHMFKKIEESMTMMKRGIEDMYIYKTTQTELLEMKIRYQNSTVFFPLYF